MTPPVTSPNGGAALAILYPTTAPGDKATVTLVSTIRHLAPQAEGPGHPAVHVGGATPSNIDFSRVLSDKLPLFIAVVVILAFLLLVMVFRSLLIPLVAALMNLLSVGAALGALTALFTWGWGSSALGLPTTGPIDAFIPVLLFSVLFGLSMDYEVYLVSRMQEEWHHQRRTAHGDAAELTAGAVRHNHEAVTLGQAKSGRIIAAAMRHHDPGLRVLPHRRQLRSQGIRVRPRLRGPRGRPGHPRAAGPRPHAPDRSRQLGAPRPPQPYRAQPLRGERLGQRPRVTASGVYEGRSPASGHSARRARGEVAGRGGPDGVRTRRNAERRRRVKPMDS